MKNENHASLVYFAVVLGNMFSGFLALQSRQKQADGIC
jgi:hypothetical protein